MRDCEFVYERGKQMYEVWVRKIQREGRESVWQKAFVVKVAILNLPLVTDGSTSLCPSLLVWPSFSLSRHLYGDSVYSVGTLTIYGKHYHTSTRDGAAWCHADQRISLPRAAHPITHLFFKDHDNAVRRLFFYLERCSLWIFFRCQQVNIYIHFDLETNQIYVEGILRTG